MHCWPTPYSTGISPLGRATQITLSELYSEMEKYARPDADHKRRVEERKLLRQQQSWQQGNQNNSRQNNQYVFPMEPSQDPKPQTTPDPYITPPTAQPPNEPTDNNSQNSYWRGRRNRGRGRGRGKGRGPSDEPKKLFYHLMELTLDTPQTSAQ